MKAEEEETKVMMMAAGDVHVIAVVDLQCHDCIGLPFFLSWCICNEFDRNIKKGHGRTIFQKHNFVEYFGCVDPYSYEF